MEDWAPWFRPEARRQAAGRNQLGKAKGLEADHAVVFDADAGSRADIYVAMSRASRTLTVVSNSCVLPRVRGHCVRRATSMVRTFSGASGKRPGEVRAVQCCWLDWVQFATLVAESKSASG